MMYELTERAIERIETEYPGAEITTDLSEQAPVQASESIVWAIENAVENAVVHADRGTARVHVSITDETIHEDGISSEWTTVTVADDGPGIPDEEVAVLRDDTTRSATRHGSGLGLWITLQLIKIFDGRLDIDRSPDPEFTTAVSLRMLPAEAGS